MNASEVLKHRQLKINREKHNSVAPFYAVGLTFISYNSFLKNRFLLNLVVDVCFRTILRKNNSSSIPLNFIESILFYYLFVIDFDYFILTEINWDSLALNLANSSCTEEAIPVGIIVSLITFYFKIPSFQKHYSFIVCPSVNPITLEKPVQF